MRRGFTLIELMVASILLGMLVIVLTMIFNQSSIAWRTGVATVASLGDTQRALGTFQEISDDILPGLGDRNVTGGAGDNRNLNNRTVSIWENDSLRLGKRAFESISGWGNAPQQTMDSAKTGKAQSISGAGSGQSAGLFIVGVMSAGPDRKFDTDDDVTTWPEDVE